MQIFYDALSPTTIDVFRKHYDQYKDNVDVNHINSHGIDIRTLIRSGTEAHVEIKKLCQKHFPDTEDDQIYANYHFLYMSKYINKIESDKMNQLKALQITK